MEASLTNMPVTRRHVQAGRLALIAGVRQNVSWCGLLSLRKFREESRQLFVVASASGVQQVVDFIFVELGRHNGRS
jgi:hypothetical protein